MPAIRRKSSSPSIELWGLLDAKPHRFASIHLGSRRSEFQQQAVRWSYILRQRGRWSQDRDSEEEIAGLASETLELLGIDSETIEALGNSTSINLHPERRRCQVIEVRIPWSDEETWWESRIMPWEHLISAATRAARGDASAVVIRMLDVPSRDSEAGRPRRSSSKGRRIPSDPVVGIVSLRPHSLRRIFEGEGFSEPPPILLGNNVKLHSLDDPSAADLEQWLKEYPPQILHLHAIDARRAASVKEERGAKAHDGIAIRGAGTSFELLYPMDVARLLTRADQPPQLIGLDVWNSAARIAPLTIAEGAEVVLALENRFDPSISELFFTSFYTEWSPSEGDMLRPFLTALDATRPYAKRIRGSGFVMWSDHTWLDRAAKLATLRPPTAQSLSNEMRIVEPVSNSIYDRISVEVEVEPEINFSLLHNQQSLLRKLIVKRKRGKSRGDGSQHSVEEAIRDIEIEVDLHLGDSVYPYRSRVALSPQTHSIDLADPMLEATPWHGPGGIHVPLPIHFLRSVEESLRTSLVIRIQWKGEFLHHQTYSVQLAPLDQWRYEDRDILWLTSFVFPRDPVVPTIVAAAQRYLSCLRDDTTAGFNGYAAYKPGHSNQDPWSGIDTQVRAIWSAIMIDHRLHYINPPPSYSESTQRIRTPSQTLDQGRGTCIDLAILFAACLEWIEIYPVLFMQDDHAFPGYWRDLEAYSDFTVPKVNGGKSIEASLANSDDPTSLSYPWYVQRNAYSEVRSLVMSGALVPLEAVCLTTQEGFQVARNAATQYFESRLARTFHSMVDIARSRHRVTPLPY